MRRELWSLALTSRLQSEGRGTGEKANYKPWLDIHSFSSLGRSHRTYCELTGRVHHFLSDLEYKNFLYCRHIMSPIDLRENYPLDVVKTSAIAASKNFRHPRNRGDNTPFVMSTDLLVSLNSVPETYIAVSVKTQSDAAKKRTKELLEIEAAYWHHECIEWRLHTEAELSGPLIRSLEWLDGSNVAGRSVMPSDQLVSYLHSNPSIPARTICIEIDKLKGRQIGDTLADLRAHLASKVIQAPLDIIFIPNLHGGAFRMVRP